MKKQVLIFGGGFSPPHMDHKQMCLMAIEEVKPDECWLMPSADRHDKGFNVSSEDREVLLGMFVESLNKESDIPVVLDLSEISKERSCTMETFQRLQQQYPEFEFQFLFGSDVIPNIRSGWIEGEFLWNNLNFLFVGRRGHPINGSPLPPKSRILSLKVGPISSTAIRKKIKEVGPLSVHGQLDSDVLDYVIEHGLYQ